MLQKISKFHIEGILGEGAMGIVYRGIDRDLQRRVAIKTIHPHLIEDKANSEFIERFKREAQTTSKCMHSNIVTVYEYGITEQKMPYLAMEFVDGRCFSR